MKTNAQSGLSTLQIIIILTVVAVLFGLVATLSSDNDADQAAQNTANTADGRTPLENLAQNIAKNKAGSVTDAAAKRNSQLQAGMDNNGTTQAASAPIVAGSFDTYSSTSWLWQTTARWCCSFVPIGVHRVAVWKMTSTPISTKYPIIPIF